MYIQRIIIVKGKEKSLVRKEVNNWKRLRKIIRKKKIHLETLI